ncbi:MAG: hypothetical protein IJO69_03010 [Ruminiclostridium sp.]|nr:hypothetical protein [Ruminiclostridium sp.]
MKKHFPLILSAIACVLAIFCLMQISDLKNQVNQLQNQLNNQDTQFREQMGAFTSQVESALEAEASILSSYDWTWGNLDQETLTAPLLFTAAPKEHTPGVTAANAIINGSPYPMTLQENGSYTLTLDWPLFETANLERVTFQENGRERSETLNISEPPFAQLLSIPFGHEMGGSARVEDGKLHYEMDIYVDNLLYGRGNDRNNAQTVAFIALRDGKEIDRIDFDLDQMERSAGHYECMESVEGKFSLPEGSTLTFLVEVTDDWGFTYHLFLSEHQSDGAQAAPLVDTYIRIYDDQGNLLWDDTYK